MSAFEFDVGEAVEKRLGYPFRGWIVGAFFNRAGEPRYVVEHAIEEGMLHIYSASQLKRNWTL